MFVPGQRWISAAEPELGLGTVLRQDVRSVQVLFAKSGVLRQYACESAPLTRAEFRPGQRVAGKGVAFLVERVEIRDDLLIYRGEGRQLEEGQLDDEQSVSQANERLMAGRVDTVAQFELRMEALRRRANVLRSPAWGLASARIDLVPHQLRVASIAASRRPPRVLLADEVGLGKTIEAGMIIARQLATGRARRVLVLLPDALINQWFVELLRRFNLAFAIFDEERCEAIEQAGDGRNPFEDEQLVIAGFDLFADDERRTHDLREAGWDMLVVDEAHHLEWTPEASGVRYTLVEELAARTPAVLLLTATPEQLGRSGHFARLRLLDPARYSDLEAYLAEADAFVALSDVAERLGKHGKLTKAARSQLSKLLRDDADALAALDAYAQDADTAERLLRALIDRHGTGRSMFRNRRAGVGGFPKRIPDLIELDADTLSEDRRQALLTEFHADTRAPATPLEPEYSDDPRIDAVLTLLEACPDDKFLLICRTRAKVLAIEEALRKRSGVGVARFHEGLGLLQRDRNAAWFAAADGARVLLCSEIGSEGRNFQFAHHLVLWDLPMDPDLLEQRIGRLDRIGQQHDITVHIPVVTNSAQHMLARWYHTALDAFAQSPSDGRELLRRFGERIGELAQAHAHGVDGRDQELDALIAETQNVHQQLSERMHAGRDRLLDMATQREPNASALLEEIALVDKDRDGDAFIVRLFEHFGVYVDELGHGVLALDPQYLNTDALPGLGEGPKPATFDRSLALAREDLALLRLDHPTVHGALDQLLASEQGNAAFLVDDALPARTVLLQSVFVLECVAEQRLDIARFLPPKPVTVTVDTRLQPRLGFEPSAAALRRAGDRNIEVDRYRKFLAKLVPPMLERSEQLARTEADTVSADALHRAQRQLGDELTRLRALKEVNPAVRDEEIDTLLDEREALQEAIPKARLRLDSVRCVVSPDFLSMR